MQPRDVAAQEGEARARQLGAGLEIHSQRGADIGVFAGFEIEAALLAPLRQFDIVALVRAVGHILRGEVGQGRQQMVELCRRSAFGLFPLGHRRFDLRDFGLERFGLVLVALAHRLADRFRRFVAAALRLLDPGRRLALVRVERDDAVGHRFGPAAGEGGVEFLRIAADVSDVVHGPAYAFSLPAWPATSRGATLSFCGHRIRPRTFRGTSKSLKGLPA